MCCLRIGYVLKSTNAAHSKCDLFTCMILFVVLYTSWVFGKYLHFEQTLVSASGPSISNCLETIVWIVDLVNNLDVRLFLLISESTQVYYASARFPTLSFVVSKNK